MDTFSAHCKWCGDHEWSGVPHVPGEYSYLCPKCKNKTWVIINSDGYIQIRQSSCIVTTACLEALGLPVIDSPYIRSLQDWRESSLIETVRGRRLITTYYHLAPAFLCKIEMMENAKKIDIFRYVHMNFTLPIHENIKLNNINKAIGMAQNFLAFMKEFIRNE